jgi:hypothetical protein
MMISQYRTSSKLFVQPSVKTTRIYYLFDIAIRYSTIMVMLHGDCQSLIQYIRCQKQKHADTGYRRLMGLKYYVKCISSLDSHNEVSEL